jgi:hypothetical protein
MNRKKDFRALKILKNIEFKSVTPLKYIYETRLKIVTYVPLRYVDKLTFELGNAGAGKIGKYDLCSFRMNGLGTYRPMRGAKPFEGKAGRISFEEEVRLEMECDTKSIDNIIDALLENHPYEEVAYEIYKFGKRVTEPVVIKVELKRPVKMSELINIVRPNTEISSGIFKGSIRRIIISECPDKDDYLKYLATREKCELVILSLQKEIIFKKI